MTYVCLYVLLMHCMAKILYARSISFPRGYSVSSRAKVLMCARSFSKSPNSREPSVVRREVERDRGVGCVVVFVCSHL